MKKSILTTLTLSTALLIVSCGNSTPKAESHEGHEPATTAVAEPASVQVNDETLNAVYQEYLNLNRALVNSSQEEAKIAANAIELGAKELAEGATLVSSAAKITAAATLEEQRVAFSDLSNALIVLVKQSGLSSGQVYVDYCPMALNNAGGYWLSSEKGIKNPYYGESMLTCGETKETI